MLVQDKEKDPSVLEHQTDRKRNTFNHSIPQGQAPKHPVTLDKFRLYLKDVLTILNAREVIP